MATRDAGSQITIDGGGSVKIDFDEAVYERGTNPTITAVRTQESQS